MDKRIRRANQKFEVTDEDNSPASPLERASSTPPNQSMARRKGEPKRVGEITIPKFQPPAPEPTVNVVKPKFAGAFLKPALPTDDIPKPSLQHPRPQIQSGAGTNNDPGYCEIVFGHSVIWHPARHWQAMGHPRSLMHSLCAHVVFLGLILVCVTAVTKIMPEPRIDRHQTVQIEFETPGHQASEPNSIAVASTHEGQLEEPRRAPQIDRKTLASETVEPVSVPFVAHRASSRRTNSENVVAKRVPAAEKLPDAAKTIATNQLPPSPAAASKQIQSLVTSTVSPAAPAIPTAESNEEKPGSSAPLMIASAGHATGSTTPYVSSATLTASAALPSAQFARALTASSSIRGSLPAIYLSTPFQFSFADDGTQNRPLKYSSDWTMLEPSETRSGDFLRSEPHNQIALQEMENARKLETAAIKQKNSGNDEAFSTNHAEAKKSATLALEHLKAHLQVIQSKQLGAAPVHTHYNMAVCYALLGDTKNCLASLQKYHACNPDGLTHRIMWGNYHIATILMAEGDHATAQQLLKTAIHKRDAIDDVEWTNFALNWELIAEAERLQGNDTASLQAHREAMRALYSLGAGAPQTAAHMRDRLFRLGIIPGEYIIGAATRLKQPYTGKILSVKPVSDAPTLVKISMGKSKGILPGMQLYAGDTILHVVQAADGTCLAEYTYGPMNLDIGGQVRTRL